MNRNDQFGPIFALAARFASEIAGMNLPTEVIQKAKEQKNHPLWTAVSRALSPDGNPNPISDETSLVLSRRFTLFIDSLRLPEEAAVAATKQGHPLWAAVKGALLPEEMPMSPGLELGVRSGDKAKIVQTPEVFVPRIQILSERPKTCAQRSDNDQITDLKRMYSELRWAWTDSGLIIPNRRKGFDRLLVFTDTGFTNNRLYDVCEASFRSWRYAADLDSAVPAKDDQRHPSRGVYAIWVRDEVDSDYDLRDTSAVIIAKRGLKTTTLLEREFLELVYHRETGGHLDTRTWTLCSGSRSSDGRVPCANWDGGRFKVDWCRPGDGSPNFRARQAVTL